MTKLLALAATALSLAVAAPSLAVAAPGFAEPSATGGTPASEIGFDRKKEIGIVQAACYYKYTWITFGGQTGYTRQLICY